MRRTTLVVNERVAGRRHFGVSGMSGDGIDGIVDTTTIHDDNRYDGELYRWTRAESHGLRFDTREERDEYLVSHGYLRPFFTSPQTRLQNIMSMRRYHHGSQYGKVYSFELRKMAYPHELSDHEAMYVVARMQRDRGWKRIMAQLGYERMRDIWIDHPTFGKRFRDREEHEFEMARAQASGYDSI